MYPESHLIFYLANIGGNVCKYRKARGLTQAELGTRLGMKQAVIASYERGFRKVPVGRLPEFAAALGVTLEELYGLKEKPEKAPIPRVHKNKREAKIQELFAQLSPADQRAFLRQIRSVLAAKGQL